LNLSNLHSDTVRFAIAKIIVDCKVNDPENSRTEKWSYCSIRKNTESSNMSTSEM